MLRSWLTDQCCARVGPWLPHGARQGAPSRPSGVAVGYFAPFDCRSCQFDMRHLATRHLLKDLVGYMGEIDISGKPEIVGGKLPELDEREA